MEIRLAIHEKMLLELFPPFEIKLNWQVLVQRYKATYELYAQAVCEMMTLFAEHDITMVQLKGIGLSSTSRQISIALLTEPIFHS